MFSSKYLFLQNGSSYNPVLNRWTLNGQTRIVLMLISLKLGFCLRENRYPKAGFCLTRTTLNLQQTSLHFLQSPASSLKQGCQVSHLCQLWSPPCWLSYMCLGFFVIVIFSVLPIQEVTLAAWSTINLSRYPQIRVVQYFLCTVSYASDIRVGRNS